MRVALGKNEAWQKLGYNVWRAKLPGGWLVATFQANTADSVTFVPDPAHVWDGRAEVGAAPRPGGGQLSLADEEPGS
ncbi:MAG: hypothetical protein H6735_11810 [Alphaproteobacteria bacterium]|nr:hypothetical protein [Alphaproteobacteria bacterium]